MSGDARIRVYIADDTKSNIEGIEALVKNSLQVVGRSLSLRLAITEICSMDPAPQVVFMDINHKLSDMDGLSALQEIRQRRPDVRFILYTAMVDIPEYPFLAWDRFRAEGFLFRDGKTGHDELVMAAKRVVDGKIHWDDEALQMARNWPFRFTPKERQALVYLALTGKTNNEIAKLMNIKTRQAATYIQNCMDQTNTHSRGELANWAKGNMRLML